MCLLPLLRLTVAEVADGGMSVCALGGKGECVCVGGGKEHDTSGLSHTPGTHPAAS